MGTKELTRGKLQPGLKTSQVLQVTPLSSSVLGGLVMVLVLLVLLSLLVS